MAKEGFPDGGGAGGAGSERGPLARVGVPSESIDRITSGHIDRALQDYYNEGYYRDYFGDGWDDVRRLENALSAEELPRDLPVLFIRAQRWMDDKMLARLVARAHVASGRNSERSYAIQDSFYLATGIGLDDFQDALTAISPEPDPPLMEWDDEADPRFHVRLIEETFDYTTVEARAVISFNGEQIFEGPCGPAKICDYDFASTDAREGVATLVRAFSRLLEIHDRGPEIAVTDIVLGGIAK